MAINIQNIVAALEAKVAAATSATETQELIVIIKSIKAAGQQTVSTYANVASLPAASVDNAGNLAYVAAVGKIYYSNGTTWTEVGSGSDAEAYDQSLNTTDDVVFNSALIGDVSIVGNEISGVDSYGNDATLVVAGGLDVKFGSAPETINGNFSLGNPQFTNPPLFYNYSSSISQENLSKFISGALITVQDTNFGLGTFVIELTSNLQYDQNAGTYTASYNPISGNMGGAAGISATSALITTSAQTTPLTVTSSGVNVDGTFTVNGQPVAGGSGFDGGSLVATDALISDVSIIGNEISAVDSYGNADTLVLNSPVEFKATETVNSQQTLSIFNTGIALDSYFQNYLGAVRFTNFSSQQIAQNLLTLTPSTEVTTSLLLNASTYTNRFLRFTISNTFSEPESYNPSLVAYVAFSVVPGTLQSSTDGVNWSSILLDDGYYSSGNATITYDSTSIVDKTVVSVTESGVNVDGTFTVNGQEITTGGSGSSFDQSLNTVDDVVFNSGLIGDIAIVGNTISGTGVYGAGEQVVVDSDLLVTGDLIISNQIGTPTNTSSPVKYVQVSVQEPKTIIDEFTLNSSMWSSIAGYGSGMNYVQIDTTGYPTTAAKLQNVKVGDFISLSTQYGNFQFEISGSQSASPTNFSFFWTGSNAMMGVDNSASVTFTSTTVTSEKKDYFLPLYN
jgi:hypothetical protein